VPPRNDTAGRHDDHGLAAPAGVPPHHDLVGLRWRLRRQRPTHLATAQPVPDEPQRTPGRPPRCSARRASPRARALGGRQRLDPRVDVDVRMNQALGAPANHTVGARRGEDVAKRRPSPTFLLGPTVASMLRLRTADLRRIAQPGPIRLREGDAGGRSAPTLIEADRKGLRLPQPARSVTVVSRMDRPFS
jgi:hypothetical protein